MGSLYVTFDVHTQERANRVSLPARYKLPLFDVDDTGVVTVPAFSGTAILSTAGVHQPIFLASRAIALFESISMVNYAGTAINVYLYLNPPGVVAANGNNLFFGGVLEPFETVQIDVPFHVALNGGLYGQVTAAGNVHVHTNGIQFTAQPAGATLRVIEGTTAAVGGTVLYTCPASGVREALVLATVFHNFTGAARFTALSSQGWFMAASMVESTESYFIEPMKVLTAGQQLTAWCDVATSCSVRATVLELI